MRFEGFFRYLNEGISQLERYNIIPLSNLPPLVSVINFGTSIDFTKYYFSFFNYLSILKLTNLLKSITQGSIILNNKFNILLLLIIK